ncbi:MAG: Ig-like domain repeat protein [Patescibacteria group bacterium]|nr:Ig-like domain repeat protein [Patescibacteria group bacterium]
MKKLLFLSALFLLPSLVFAAGFAKQSLFLSKSPVTEGDAVQIYAVLSNDAGAAFAGTLVVSDGSAQIGTRPISMAAGGAQTVSLPWKPLAGSHTIKAALEDSGGVTVEQETEVFVINPKPVPATTAPASVSQPAAVESSAQIQQDISGISPQAASLSQPIFSTVDSLRGSMSKLIDSQLGVAKNNLANHGLTGLVEGTSTSALPNTMGDFWFVLWTLYLYALTILQFLISNAGVFYPLLVIVFFYLLYRTYRWARRPSY